MQFSSSTFEFENKPQDDCYLTTLVENSSAIDDIAMVVCYWIVMSEISCFIMGYPAGMMKPGHYIFLSILNFIMNISLTVVLTPALSCLELNKDSVNPIY